MRSNVCKIEKGSKDLARILNECEKVAVYNGLSHKQGLQLRLLCEEIDGMLPEILGDFEGVIWIELEEGLCKVHISVTFTDFTVEKKKELLGLAKNKKNSAAKGLVGKIRSVLEDVFFDADLSREMTTPSASYYLESGCTDYTYLWTLEQYRSTVKTQEDESAWDELEKSVIASVADDIVVGVKGMRAEIILVKNFAQGAAE